MHRLATCMRVTTNDQPMTNQPTNQPTTNDVTTQPISISASFTNVSEALKNLNYVMYSINRKNTEIIWQNDIRNWKWINFSFNFLNFLHKLQRRHTLTKLSGNSPFLPFSFPSYQPSQDLTTSVITSPTLIVSSSSASAAYSNSTTTSTSKTYQMHS